MKWLRAAPLLALPFALAAVPFACSNSSTSSGGTSPGSTVDGGGANATKLEAGSPCGSATDCENGLVCLYPANATSTCNTFKVCVTPPPSPCPSPQTMCSCLVEPVQVCQGYAENPVDPTITCEGGAVIPPSEGGVDAGADGAVPPDAGLDSGVDAADAAGD